MTKYDERFKLRAIERCLSGQRSVESIARELAIDYSMLRRWVASYQLHGRMGLGGPRQRYTAEFKLEVLQRIRRDGLSDRQAVAIYKLGHAGTIGQWRRQYDEGGLGALEPQRPERPAMPHKDPPKLAPQDMTEQQLREENAYLRAELDYLKKLDALIQAERTEALVKKRKWSKG